MKYTQWINLGRDMVLVDQQGAIVGLIITMDEQIGRKIRNAFYAAPRASQDDREDGHRLVDSELKIS